MINDTYGHQAGDQILTRPPVELAPVLGVPSIRLYRDTARNRTLGRPGASERGSEATPALRRRRRRCGSGESYKGREAGSACSPTPGEDASLPAGARARRDALYRGAGRKRQRLRLSAPRGRGVQKVPELWSAWPGIRAHRLQGLRGRGAVGVFVQSAGSVPVVRGTANGRYGGAAA